MHPLRVPPLPEAHAPPPEYRGRLAPASTRASRHRAIQVLVFPSVERNACGDNNVYYYITLATNQSYRVNSQAIQLGLWTYEGLV